jgi:NADPH:quinone reductase-like Zn-dependent oxidoreductase
MSYEEAAAIPFGATASLYFLRKGKIKKGHKVLVYGASGALGTAAVQLAKHFEAEVTAVCSTSNIDMMYSLGADKVIDYTKEDFSKNGETYDIIYETVGKSSFSDCINSLNKNGVLLLANTEPSLLYKGLWTAMSSKKKIVAGVIKESAQQMNFFKELIEQGELKAIIDKSYPLEQIVEAHAYVDRGHKRGNVTISISK